MSQIRREVLQAFKKLHRTRQYVFAGDVHSLESARREINNGFKRNMDETDPYNINKMLKFALDIDKELRTCVIQAREKADGVYELRINHEIIRKDNVPYKESAIEEAKK